MSGSSPAKEPRNLPGGESVTMQETGAAEPQVARGLEGIVVAATEIAEVDGRQGRLTLRGYDIAELFGRCSFEEIAYLLWHGRLPTAEHYQALLGEMRRARELPGPALAALRELAPNTSGMHLLR